MTTNRPLKHRMTTHHRRHGLKVTKASKASILAYIDQAVVPKSGKAILAIVLYAKFIKRTGADVSAKRFFRILAKHGYRARPELGGDIFENITFTN